MAAAEHNARLLRSAGVRWARDVGSPTGTDPVDGRIRALALGVRDRWAGHREYPYVRAAGTWVVRAGGLPGGLGVEVDDGDALLAAVTGQLDDGADLVKLYLDGPDRETSPFTVGEVRAAVELAARRAGPRVAAHSGLLPGARVGAEAGVDSLEHGFQLDADVARTMAANGVALVSTLAVLESWRSFASTTTLPRFAEPAGRARIAARAERAHESVRLAAARRRADRGRHRLRRRLDPGQPAGLGGRVPGRPPAWSRGRRWPRPPATAARCSASRTPA